MAFGDLIDKAKKKASDLKEMGTEFGMDKVQKFLDEFNSALALIEAGGYRLIDLDIALGMPPMFAPCFQLIRDVSDEEQAANLARVADNKRAHMMLSTLYKTSKLQASLNIGDLHAMGIVLEIGAMPVTRIRYVDTRRAELTGTIGG
ncbi:MAG: hypothetical protein KC620_02555 [Myxococcales bacterium]|nr:hypothetical protein [Myxococcales bacterium]